jgi:peptide/nickel transport system substrate-binding protein
METMPPSGEVISAKDKAVGVISTEPADMNAIPSVDAHTRIIMDTVYSYMGLLSRDTGAVVPTPMLESWTRTAPDTWEFKLRDGVTFQDGEPWNADAWKTYSEFAGVPEFNASSYNHTGPYTVEAVDPLTAKITCGTPCPLFAQALNLSTSFSPKTLREEDFHDIRLSAGTGPFKIEEWIPGQKIRTTAFDGFVALPDNPELVAPHLKEIEWQWREETTVRTAMITAGEADWAFLLTQEDTKTLGPDRYITGGTSETAMMRIDTLFDPWTSQVEMRQAIVHSIDCQAIVDALYDGTTTCRGNVAAPGVIGITDANIAPYEYNPQESRRLLESIGYICGMPNSSSDCEAEIKITSRAARISSNTELIESIASYMSETGINAKANVVEVGISQQVRTCGVGSEGATVAGWNGATENHPPSCPMAQIVEHIGFGYELMDYGKVVTRHLNCISTQSSVCLPNKQDEWQATLALEGAERQAALAEVADYARDNVFFLPLFDLSAIYGLNPKLKGFEHPRDDKHLYANLWWFEE